MSIDFSQPNFHVMVAVRGQDDFWPLLCIGYALARSRYGRLSIVTVRQQSHERPEWLVIQLPGYRPRLLRRNIANYIRRRVDWLGRSVT